MYLEKINGPEDVKKIKIDELPVLAQEKGRVSGHARLEYGADILSGCNKAAGRTDDFRWLKGDKGFWQTQ